MEGRAAVSARARRPTARAPTSARFAYRRSSSCSCPERRASSTSTLPSPAAWTATQRNGPDAQLVEALCVEQGMPVELLPDYSEFEILTTIGGNPDLDPETADTVTAGIVVRPGFESPWMRDLQFTIDWYRIEIDDVVTYRGYRYRRAELLRPRLQSGLRCGQLLVHTVRSRSGHRGDRRRVRNVPEPRHADDVRRRLPARLGPARRIRASLASACTLAGWTSSSSRRRATYLRTQFAGTIGGFAGSYPEWKWLANLRYTWRDLEAGLSWQYVDSTVDNSRFFKTNDVTIPHKDYFDVDASYTIDGRLVRRSHNPRGSRKPHG